MGKQALKTSVEPKTAATVKARAAELGLSVSALIALAVETELGNFNVHKENKRLQEACREKDGQLAEAQEKVRALEWKLSETKTNLEATQREADENIKQIAVKLGVPDTVQHCRRRIDGLHKDVAKARHKLAQLLTRGLIARIFNIVPKG